MKDKKSDINKKIQQYIEEKDDKYIFRNKDYKELMLEFYELQSDIAFYAAYFTMHDFFKEKDNIEFINDSVMESVFEEVDELVGYRIDDVIEDSKRDMKNTVNIEYFLNNEKFTKEEKKKIIESINEEQYEDKLPLIKKNQFLKFKNQLEKQKDFER